MSSPFSYVQLSFRISSKNTSRHRVSFALLLNHTWIEGLTSDNSTWKSRDSSEFHGADNLSPISLPLPLSHFPSLHTPVTSYFLPNPRRRAEPPRRCGLDFLSPSFSRLSHWKLLRSDITQDGDHNQDRIEGRRFVRGNRDRGKKEDRENRPRVLELKEAAAVFPLPNSALIKAYLFREVYRHGVPNLRWHIRSFGWRVGTGLGTEPQNCSVFGSRTKQTTRWLIMHLARVP